MDKEIWFVIAIIPLFTFLLIGRIYLLKHLDKPADFSKAPWWVKITLNATRGKIMAGDLKKSVLMSGLGFLYF